MRARRSFIPTIAVAGGLQRAASVIVMQELFSMA